MTENQEHHEHEWQTQDNNTTLSSNNSETTSKPNECYQKLPLYLFIVIYVSFCCLCALCLTVLERPTERLERLRLHASQINFLRSNPCVSSEELQMFVSYIVSATKMGISMTPIKNISRYDSLKIPDNWHKDFYSETNAEVNAQLESIARSVLTEEELNNSSWNFYESVFFVVTVMTTIGYGTISPVTTYGKAFCIFLVAVGIPLNVILVSVLASLIMPAIRDSRNALVSSYYHSSGHDASHNYTKTWKHSDFDDTDEHRRFSTDVKLCLDKEENNDENSHICFKFKSLFRRQVNTPDVWSECGGFHKTLSNSHLSNNNVKNDLHSTMFDITGPNNVIESKELTNKTTSPNSSFTTLSISKCHSQSPTPIKTINYPKDLNETNNNPELSKHEQSNKPISSIMKHHVDNTTNLNLSSAKTNRSKTKLDHTDTPKKLTHKVSLSFTPVNHPDSAENIIQSPSSQFSECIGKNTDVKNVNRPVRHSLSELFKDVAQNRSNFNDCFSTETSLADRAHLSCIAFLHYLLSRSDLALTTQLKLSQFRYVSLHHGIFRLRLLHFFIVFSVVIMCSIIIPGIIFAHLEQNWTYFDAIYFCIISLSAVGLGDMVASESNNSGSSLVTILYVKNIYRVMTATV
ncbi:unnamed protein product [Schistosoma turkestanicum]|nr:unnamed protein product [Schistosoma turkestanicum]